MADTTPTNQFPNWRQVLVQAFDKALKALRVTIVGTINGIFTQSGLNNGGQDTLIPINDTTWTKLERSALTTPSSPTGILSGRNSLKIHNTSGVQIATTVNESPGAQVYEVGDPIEPGNSQFLDVAEKKPNDDPINIYAMSSSGNVTINIRELA